MGWQGLGCGEIWGGRWAEREWRTVGPHRPPCRMYPQQPRPRLFHASALLGDTMVVLGGRSEPDEFSSDVLLYQVNCNTWLLPDLIGESAALLGGPGTTRGSSGLA